MEKRKTIRIEQRQKQKLSTRKIAFIVSGAFGICLIISGVIFTFNIGNFRSSLAGESCSSCDYTVSGTISENVNLGNNSKFCVSEGAVFTGRLTIGNNSEICNQGTFHPQNLSVGNNSSLNNMGNFIYDKSLSENGFDITNTGTISIDGNFTNKGVFNTADSVLIDGNFENSSSGGTEMTSSGYFYVSGKFTNKNSLQSSDTIIVGDQFINSNSGHASFTNTGYLQVGGKFQNKNDLTNSDRIIVNGEFINSNSGGASFINSGILYVGGAFTNKNDFTNNDSVLVVGDFENNNSGAASIVNNGSLTIQGDFENKNDITNNGYFEIYKNFTMNNSGSAQVNNDSVMIVRRNLTSNNDFYNYNLLEVNGILTNESSNGSLHLGPNSLINVDSLINEDEITSVNTTYGQIIIGSYFNNESGANISDYVDICKSGGGNPFDLQNGNVGSDVTFCQNNSPLPVELVFFNAELVDGNVIIKWATASEKNNDKFEIQRSDNGSSFKAIGEVKGAGNSLDFINYSYTDPSPSGTNLYYRLRQVDFDGSEEYSEIKVVKLNGNNDLSNPSIIRIEKLGPNPFNQGFKMNIASEKQVKVNIALINMNGQTMYSESLMLFEGINTYHFFNGGQLKEGVYVLNIVGEGFSESRKLIKKIF